MKDVILRRGGYGFEGAGEESSRQWNVRTRRGEYGVVSGGGSGGGAQNVNLGVIKNSGEALMVSPLRMVEGEATQRLRRVETSVKEMGVASPSGEKKERVKFSVSLTRREIEEDFIAMVRHRPPRRPMKRPKYIQKQLDTLFPGVSLSEITADMYKVPETQ
ncbi:hypothetical protein LIER_18673 [Lithospermum erythrorhizon]|uniref:Uncharacterized protein n=1 Tax=Lithospermum erythrorhizon TaxID=34254 RepID=A0AAV3QHI8_LITER